MVVVIVVNVVVVALGLKHPKQHLCVASEQGVPQLSHVSRLQAALRFACGVSCNSGGSRIPSKHTGSTRP